MPLIEPPGLTDFIASLLPFERMAYKLEKGNFAGHQIHFLDHGSRTGQVVLMLHGNPTWSFLWRKVITALDPDQFRCVAPDLLGLGYSSKPRETTAHTLAGHVEVMCEWFAALDLQDVILVGQDWGGPIVTGIGARFPNRIIPRRLFTRLKLEKCTGIMHGNFTADAQWFSSCTTILCRCPMRA